jgi:hypothetical protein
MTYAAQDAGWPAADLRPQLPAAQSRDTIGRVATRLTWLAAALALVAALFGLLADGL